MAKCDRRRLFKFLSKELDVDKELDLLYHLEKCPECWEEVYNAVRAQHPHYYKRTARRVKLSEKELERMDKRKEKKVSEVA